jgi:hypothetical protein
MALTIFQELIPFSNERLEQPVSGNGYYNNPIVMPLSFDVVQYNNTLETVVYIRNPDTSVWYENVVVHLAKIVGTDTDWKEVEATCTNPGLVKKINFKDALGVVEHAMDFTYSSDVIQPFTTRIKEQIGKREVPIMPGTDSNIDAKFSYGYDELSNIDWAKKKPAVVIKSIGNIITPDTSYIPVRLRLEVLMESLPLYTLRDYSVSIAYGAMWEIGKGPESP